MSIDPAEDHRFMALALALGRRGLGNVWPNPAVGAVVVRHEGGKPVLLGRGWTQPGGRPHAETEALRRAGPAARGATLYVTLEPCSHQGNTGPCADAVIAAGIARVVSALDDPNPLVSGQGHTRLRASDIAVEIGAGKEQALRAHAGHIRRMRDGRPHVTLKLAISSNGKAGLAGRRPVAITGKEAGERVHLLRAMNDAILIGLGTARADDPQLTCRLPGMGERSPVRVVLDAGLRLPLTSRLVRTARETPVWVIAATSASDQAENALRAERVEILRVEAVGDRIDLGCALKALAARGLTRLLVEGGPTIAAAFVSQDLVDEAWLFRSPQPIGVEGIDALEGLPLSALTQSRLIRRTTESVGADELEMFERA